jgi:hypothetical protein
LQTVNAKDHNKGEERNEMMTEFFPQLFLLSSSSTHTHAPPHPRESEVRFITGPLAKCETFEKKTQAVTMYKKHIRNQNYEKEKSKNERDARICKLMRETFLAYNSFFTLSSY